jgi:hypothetical protein
MGHFAKVVNGKVTEVIVAEPEFFETFVDSSPGTWIQTSYNTLGGVHLGGGVPLRGNYASIGYTYDDVNDVFYAPRPVDRNGLLCNSWTISAPTWIWKPPVECTQFTSDSSDAYQWDEPTLSWIKVA